MRSLMFPVAATAMLLAACGADEEACSNRTEIAHSRIDSVRQANLQCFDASDCTTIDVSTDCAGRCPDAVNTAGVATVEAEIAAADAGVCADNKAEGCSYSTPGCAQGTLICDAGSCVLQLP